MFNFLVFGFFDKLLVSLIFILKFVYDFCTLSSSFFQIKSFNAWFKKCLLALFFLTLYRIAFYAYLNHYFSNYSSSQILSSFVFGVWFDVQTVVYFLLPFHLTELFAVRYSSQPWLKHLSNGMFVFCLGILLLLNFIDLEFYKIKGKRSGYELIQLIKDPANSISSYFIHYWYLLIGYIILLLIIWYFLIKIKSIRVSFSWKHLPILLSLIGLLFIGARGGLYLRPLRSFDASRFVQPGLINLTINSGNQFITSIASSKLERKVYFSQNELNSIYNPIKSYKPLFKSKPNIVLIVLESFGRDYCGFLNKSERYTPFLDQLSKKSLVYEHAYACGTTSIESIPAIFASIPSLSETAFINSPFQTNKILGVHHYLSKNYYDCSFYYGTANGSMGFDNFLKSSGNIHYYGLNEYPNPKSDHDGHWGIWDHIYFDYFLTELSNKKTPFFSSIFSLSSHDPYKIPDHLKNQFKDGELPLHKAVGYSDYSLKLFFEKAEKQPWFSNTIFIITADHASHSKNSYFYSPMGKYEIPFLIYSPKYFSPQIIDSTTVSHLDVFPTIMHITGNGNEFFSLGNSIFEHTNRQSLNYDVGINQIIQYPYCNRYFPNNKSIMYAQEKDVPNDSIRYLLNSSELVLKNKLDTILKAKLQIYTNHLIDNTYFKE